MAGQADRRAEIEEHRVRIIAVQSVGARSWRCGCGHRLLSARARDDGDAGRQSGGHDLGPERTLFLGAAEPVRRRMLDCKVLRPAGAKKKAGDRPGTPIQSADIRRYRQIMFPLSIIRVGIAFVVVAICLGLIEQLVTVLGGSRLQADFASTVGVVALLMSWPWIGPALTERLMDPSKLQLDEAKHEEVTQAICKMLPAGVKPPRLVFFKDEVPQGISLGTKHGSIMALSTGVSSGMSDSQMRAVVAHELGHILGGHTTQSFWFLGALFFSKGLFGAFGLPVAMFLLLIYLYLLRSNEFEADRRAAVLVGRESMSAALVRLKSTTRSNKVNESRWVTWLSTHPAFSQRIERLKGG